MVLKNYNILYLKITWKHTISTSYYIFASEIRILRLVTEIWYYGFPIYFSVRILLRPSFGVLDEKI